MLKVHPPVFATGQSLGTFHPQRSVGCGRAIEYKGGRGQPDGTTGGVGRGIFCDDVRAGSAPQVAGGLSWAGLEENWTRRVVRDDSVVMFSGQTGLS